jgi:hypothetical protein
MHLIDGTRICKPFVTINLTMRDSSIVFPAAAAFMSQRPEQASSPGPLQRHQLHSSHASVFDANLLHWPISQPAWGMLRTIRAAAPRAEEVIAMCVPKYRQNDALVSFDLAPTAIRFSADSPLPKALVAEIVRDRQIAFARTTRRGRCSWTVGRA